jgi:cytochrome c553
MRLAILSIPLVAVLALGAAATTSANVVTPPAFVSITLPATRGEFQTAPGSDLATGRCLVCHSAEYVYTQPPLSKAQWTAEIKKMKNVYGATFIDDADIEPLATYLVGQNGKP